MISIKVHKGSGKTVTCVCDSELIGKIFKEKKLILNVTKQFYKGDLIKEEEVKDMVSNANNLNIVGKRSIKIALGLDFILKENIIIIKGVPHAQSIILWSYNAVETC